MSGLLCRYRYALTYAVGGRSNLVMLKFLLVHNNNMYYRLWNNLTMTLCWNL